MSAFTKKSYKRKRGKDPLIDGEPDSAQAVTHTTVKVTLNDGTTFSERVLVFLDVFSPSVINKDHTPDIVEIPYDIDHCSPVPDTQKTYRVNLRTKYHNKPGN